MSDTMLSKPKDIISRLMDCQKEAFLVGQQFIGDNRRGFDIFQKTFGDAACEIEGMQKFIKEIQAAIEAEGYSVMIDVNGDFSELLITPASQA